MKLKLRAIKDRGCWWSQNSFIIACPIVLAKRQDKIRCWSLEQRLNCGFLETLISLKVRDVNRAHWQRTWMTSPFGSHWRQDTTNKKSVINTPLKHLEPDVWLSHITRNQCYSKSSPSFHQLFLLLRSSIPVRTAAPLGSCRGHRGATQSSAKGKHPFHNQPFIFYRPSELSEEQDSLLVATEDPTSAPGLQGSSQRSSPFLIFLSLKKKKIIFQIFLFYFLWISPSDIAE